MNWEQRFCPNQDCAVDSWLVQQISGHHELWELHYRFSDGAFTIAATDPVCPRCGSTLVLLEDLAHHNDGARETGQVLEFMRDLRRPRIRPIAIRTTGRGMPPLESLAAT